MRESVWLCVCVCVCVSGVCWLSDVVDLVKISNDLTAHLAYFHVCKCMRESVWLCVCVCVCVGCLLVI